MYVHTFWVAFAREQGAKVYAVVRWLLAEICVRREILCECHGICGTRPVVLNFWNNSWLVQQAQPFPAPVFPSLSILSPSSSCELRRLSSECLGTADHVKVLVLCAMRVSRESDQCAWNVAGRAHVLVVNDDVNYCVCSHCIHSNGHRRNFSHSPSVGPSPSSVNPFHLSVPMTILAYRFCTTTTTSTRIICEWGVCCMCMNGVFELFIGTNPCWLLCSGIHIEEVLISGVPQVNWIWLGKTSNWWRVLQRFVSL